MKVICLRLWDTPSVALCGCSRVECISVADGAPAGMIRGGESRLKARLGPQRVMWVSLLVRMSDGLDGACAVFWVWHSGDSSSSDSGGLKRGDKGNSDVRRSDMERCFRMGFLAMPLERVGEGDAGRSKAAAVVGDGFGV